MGFQIGNYVANLGHSLGLPEFGISERLGGFNQQQSFRSTTPVCNRSHI